MSWRKGFDVTEFLTTVAKEANALLEGKTVGALLVGEDGKIHNSAGTDAHIRELQETQLRLNEGPIAAALNTGRSQIVEDTRAEVDRWRRVGPMALEIGALSGASIPLLGEDQAVIGSIQVAMGTPHGMTPKDIALMEMISQMVALTLSEHFQHRTAAEKAAQLQTALNEQRVIDQAKGWVARAMDIPPREAYELMRSYARSRRMRVFDLSQAILEDPDCYDVQAVLNGRS